MEELSALVTICILATKSINTQYTNIIKKDYDKVEKFLSTVLVSAFIVILAKFQTFCYIPILDTSNMANLFIITIAVAFSATGSFDVVKDIIGNFQKPSKKK